MNILKKALKRGQLAAWAEYKKDLLKKHPLSYLFWECTLNCNFFCKHCGSSAGRKVYKDDLKTEEIKKAFLDISKNFDTKKITIAVTGGEPLMRQDLLDIMSYAVKLGFNWGMVTNGSLMTKEMAKKLKKAGMKTVVVSIDGLGEEHDEFRNFKGAYERAINAVKYLSSESFLQDLQITTTITPANIDKLDEMYRTFVPLGITSWRLIEVDPIGRAEENKEVFLSPDQLKFLLNFIKQLRKKSKINISFGCSGFLGEEFEGEVRDWLFRCAAGVTSASILQNGDIFVCPNVPRDKAPIEGNVKKDSFSEAWKNKFNFYRDENRTKCATCTECDHWDDCRGGSLHHWDFSKKKPKVCYYCNLKQPKSD